MTDALFTITGIGWATTHGVGRGGMSRAFAMVPGSLPPLSRKDVFDEPNPRFGRLSGYARLGLAAIAFALRDAGLDRFDAKRPIGIVAGSRLGCLSTDLEYFDALLPENGGLASPALFAYTLANCFLGEAALHFGLTGPAVVVTESPDADGLDPLRMALETIETGACDVVLAGCCEFPATPSPPGIEIPLPGALFFLLEKNAGRTDAGYGHLALREDDAILHDGAPAADLTQIAYACLSPDHPRSESPS